MLLSLVLQSQGSGRAIIQPASPDVSRTASGSPAGPDLDGSPRAALRTVPPRARPSMSAAPTPRYSATPAGPTATTTPSASVPSATATPSRTYASDAAWRQQGRSLDKCVDVEPWCPVLSAVTRKGFVRLTTGVCRPLVHGGSAMTFPTGQEIDFVASRPGGREVWRWSRGQRFSADEHTIQVEGGDCVTWTVVWDAVGDDGRPLPPGPYVVRAHVLSDVPLPRMELTIHIM